MMIFVQGPICKPRFIYVIATFGSFIRKRLVLSLDTSSPKQVINGLEFLHNHDGLWPDRY